LFAALIVTCIVFVLSFKRASAQAENMLHSFGEHLLLIPEGKNPERRVQLNGQWLNFEVSTVPLSLEESLDSYAHWCRGQNRAQEWSELLFRSERQSAGTLACIKHPEFGVGSERLGQRMMKFVDTGNLLSLGEFQYVYAAAAEEDGRTRVVRVSTQGDFYPFAMFAEEGDAPGQDPKGFTRLPNSKRLLSAAEKGHSESLAVYEVAGSLTSVTNHYRNLFAEEGWMIARDEEAEAGQHLLVIQRSTTFRIVAISSLREGWVSLAIASSDE
jgi:hypothetical protein